jgi:hypothetical protein
VHIIWRGQFRFQIIVSPAKGEQLKINIDDSKILVGDFVIEGPGEYEIKDVFVQGVNSDYLIDAEGMRICYLLGGEKADEFGEVDILLVPANKAKLVSQIEPRIVIPMGVSPPGISKFLKEMGRKTITPQPKLLIKKKDLPREETEIVVLKP